MPSVEETTDHLSHPNPSPEAVALYRYLHDEWGSRILSGQQYEPWWGIDELEYIESVTGRQPAVIGADFIHGDRSRPVSQAMEYWDRGGITAIMWHWGSPGHMIGEDEYDRSLNTDMDAWAVFDEGSSAHQAFWDELNEVADHLETLRDAGVPIIWRPFHEFDGGWFWWGGNGADAFTDLWETMHWYLVEERDLDNLVWLLPHADYPSANWVPDRSTFDLWGADTYSADDSYERLYWDTVSVHSNDRPIIKHETGHPPDPDAAANAGAWWSMWINWHTDWLTDVDDWHLESVYNHELTVTLDDVPNIVAEYGGDAGGTDPDGPPEIAGNTPQDLTGDGLYEDVTGDGQLGFNDVVTFFEEHDSDAVQGNVEYFDFSGSGGVGFNDVIALFERL
ncbi:hypothetical protein GCM10025298_04850 [Natronobiforma cellulositropha]